MFVSVIEAGAGTVTTDEDISYIFELQDFQFSGVSVAAIESVTITALPAQGMLLLNGVAVTENQTISAADIAGQDLVFTPFADDNSGAYASIDFFVNDGNSSISVLAGEVSTFTLRAGEHGGNLPQLDALLANSQHFGASGTVDSSISVVEATDTVNSTYLSSGDVLFDGFTANAALTPAERADIQAWVQAGGVLIATSDLPSNNALGSHYGLTVTSSGDTDWKISDLSLIHI